jgi:hypothetical protein
MDLCKSVPLTEGVSGDEPESERDAASCGLARNHDPREAPERHRPPATTSGTCECSNARPKDTAHVHRPEVSPRRARGQKTAAVERREASVPRRADGVSYRRGDAADLREWSALNSGCRRTRAPVGAPLPSFLTGDLGKARRTIASRERIRLLTLYPSS